MSAVEVLLKKMTESSARGLRSMAAVPRACSTPAGTAEDATSNALTRQEILQMIGPIIPGACATPAAAGNQRRIRSPITERRFQSHDPSQRRRDRVSIVPDPNGSAPAPSPAAPCPASAPAAPAASTAGTGGRQPSRRAGHRSPLSSHGGGEGVGPAPVHGNAAAHPQGWRIQPLEADAPPMTPTDGRAASIPSRRTRIARNSRSATTPTSPTRSRALADSAPTCSRIERAGAACSASFPRRSSRLRSSACRRRF